MARQCEPENREDRDTQEQRILSVLRYMYDTWAAQDAQDAQDRVDAKFERFERAVATEAAEMAERDARWETVAGIVKAGKPYPIERTAIIRHAGGGDPIIRHFISVREIADEAIVARLNREGFGLACHFIDIVDTQLSSEIL